ncbi:hypothetical protein, partial [Sphingobacterium sp. BS-2]|uniref:hypothetical protein n=1 Tax=Sphingobacterium sp. BS-2 TaxID=3377129 RepID=UPI0038FD0A64
FAQGTAHPPRMGGLTKFMEKIQDRVRPPFGFAQGTAHPTRMGGWTKIMVNLSLERPQYCRGVSHTPAAYKPKLLSSSD